MTAPGQYAAGDNSFARSAGGAAGRGIVLIVVAVALGAFLLARGFDGAGSTSSATSVGDSGGSGDTSGADDTPAEDPVTTDPVTGDVIPGEADDTTSTTRPFATNAPGDVRVAAVNGTGTSGLAGAASNILKVEGYVTGAKNAVASPVEESVIYYQAGFSEDAKAVASALSAPADVIKPAPDNVLSLIGSPEDVADFDVFVFLGADGVIQI